MTKPTVPTGKRGVSYIRVSRDQQETARQRDSIGLWLVRLGLTLTHTFEDTGSRDLAAKRPRFQRLLKAVEAGLIDWIIVDSQDRFGTKDAHEWGKFLSLLNEHGCELWSVSQGLLSGTDDATVLTGTIGALTSTREQREKAGRSIEGKVRKARQGLYQGGYPPYGCDVVCYGPEGQEKWRVLYMGHFTRLKIHPDGTRESFDGKGNFPAKDPQDELRIAPSVETRRIEVVRQIFETFDAEAISLNAIASRLIDAKEAPVFGDTWNEPKVKSILENPAYIGFPTWNKRGGSRFVEFIDGAFREVPKSKGKIVAGRRRGRQDFVQGVKPAYDPMIPPEMWERVQRKLGEIKGPKKGPRSAELWLKGFLVCARCGKPMRGWHPRKDKYLWKSYFCGTYGSYGPKNPAGCKLHRVKAELLEQVVATYIEEKHGQLKAMIEAQERGDRDLIQPLAADLAEKWAELVKIEERMEKELASRFQLKPGPPTKQSPESAADMYLHLNFAELQRAMWEAFCRPKPSSAIPEIAAAEAVIDHEPWAAFLPNLEDLRAMWSAYSRHREPELAREVEEAEGELARLVDSYGKLPPNAKRAREIANARIEELEARLDSMNARQEDIGQRWDELRDEVLRLFEAFHAAREALRGEATCRRKAEALGKAVDKIICHFRYSDGKGKTAKSFLDRVEIVPLVGESVSYPASSYPNAASLGRD